MPNEELNPIRQDYLSGMSYMAIGWKYGIDPRTAKRYAQNNFPIKHLEERPFSSVLDQYKPIIDSWLSGGKIPSTTIHDRLLELGCICGYTIVNDYVQKIRMEYEDKLKHKVDIQSKALKKEFEPSSYIDRQKTKISIEKERFNGKWEE